MIQVYPPTGIGPPNAVGYREVPQTSQSASYTNILSGSNLLHPSADSRGALLIYGGSSDPFFSSVALLCHFDSSSGTPRVYPYKGSFPNTLSNVSGNVPDVSSAQSKFGGFSLAYAASGNSRVQATWNPGFQMGTGDATVEFWMRPSSNVTGIYVLFDNRVSGAAGFVIRINGTSGVIAMFWNSADRITSAGGTIVANTWHHIAWCRASGTSRLFVDGTQVGSDYADTNSYNQDQVVLGAAYNGALPAVSYYFDEWRLTIGQARYTANFTPPTEAFPDS